MSESNQACLTPKPTLPPRQRKTEGQGSGPCQKAPTSQAPPFPGTPPLCFSSTPTSPLRPLPRISFHCLYPSVTPSLNEQGLGGSWEALRHPFPSKRNSQDTTSLVVPLPTHRSKACTQDCKCLDQEPAKLGSKPVTLANNSNSLFKKYLSWDRHFTSGFFHDF